MNAVLLGLVFASLLGAKQGGPCTPSWVPSFAAYPPSSSDPDALNNEVRALVAFDDGSGPAYFAGGGSFTPGGELIRGIMKRDGTSWSQLGSGLGGFNPTVNAMVVFDDGQGPALFAGGGGFDSAGGVAANRIARWDGADWSALGDGVDNSVNAFAVFDDGTGPALYAGGHFSSAGGVAANCVARWDGSSWSALGSGLAGGVVKALATFDDGNGAALFVGGTFTSAGGVPASRVARWNGTSWSAVGSGVTGAVHALTVFDDGSGAALYAGGGFGIPGAQRIARWNGSSWSAVGTGIELDEPVYALHVFDDGSGPALYATGDFSTVMAPFRIARWNGTSWSALGSGLNDEGQALLAFDDGTGAGASLFVGGRFFSAPDSGDAFLARWQGCRDTLAPVIACPGPIVVDDSLAGPPGEVVTYSVSASDERDPSPALVCVPASGSVFPPGLTRVTCTATDVAGNATTCVFEVFVDRKIRRR